MSQILIVARDAATRNRLAGVAKECGVGTELLEDFEPALARIQKEAPTLVVAEDPPNDEIMEKLTTSLQNFAPVTPLLICLPELNTRRAIKRMTEGAYDCLCPPLTAGDFLAASKRAVGRLGRRLPTTKVVKRKAVWRHPALGLVAALLIFTAVLGLGLRGAWAPPFQIYKLANEHAVSVAGGTETVWVADWSQQTLAEMRVKGDYVSITNVHKIGEFQPVCVAVAPYYVYTASTDGRLYRHRRDTTLSVTASVPGPGFAPTGLAWDGQSLWSCDSETGKIYEYDARLAVKNTVPSPVAKPAGLAWHRGALWVADGESGSLWKLTRSNTEWRKQGPFRLQIFSHNRHLKLTGMTIWDDKVWFVSENDGILVRHKVPEEKS